MKINVVKETDKISQNRHLIIRRSAVPGEFTRGKVGVWKNVKNEVFG